MDVQRGKCVHRDALDFRKCCGERGEALSMTEGHSCLGGI